MNIRHADKDDVKVLQNLNDDVFVDNAKYDADIKTDWAQSEGGERYFTNIVNNKDSICLIAEDNNIAIGYIAGSPREFDYRLSRYIEIENMGVSPTYRSKGVGSILMKECIKIAKERGFQKVYVNVYIKNSKAIKFYENNEFKRIDLSLEKNI